MYIYHALINALCIHTIHINLNTIFYTLVEHSRTKTICIRYYMETHTYTCTRNDCSSHCQQICRKQLQSFLCDHICHCVVALVNRFIAA